MKKMVEKRAKSIEQVSTRDGDVDISVERQQPSCFVNAPNRLFIGLTCMGVPDCDSLRSPTSPLDFKLFSTSNWTRFPKPSLDSLNKCWVCNKLGLGSIVDSPDENHHVNVDDDAKFGAKTSILFGSQVTSETPTNGIVCEPPKTNGSSHVLFHSIANMDSKRLPSEISRLGAFSACDVRANSSCSIEQSEDYTCVITHGPNPKTTHIFGDCNTNGILCKNKIRNPENITSCLEIHAALSSTCLSTDFLSYCNFCDKKLEQGKDIYMYRGEKAFCSWDCRLEGISIQEQKEDSMRKSVTKTKDKNFDKSIFVAI